jgi:two-component sensor histidine kinase
MLNELNHRVKNTLATVQAMAKQTLRKSSDIVQAQAQFEARLIALSKAHDILTREHWEGASLRQVIDEAVVPYRANGRDRFKIEGPNVWVSPKFALALGMALHELCTNAVKYGALSNELGHVSIIWGAEGVNGVRRLRMRWAELNGPSVVPPTQRGFGSALVEHGLKQDLDGLVRLEFPPAGVTCIIDTALEP